MKPTYTELESRKVIRLTLEASEPGRYLNRGLLPGYTVLDNNTADIKRMIFTFDLNNIEECPPYQCACYGFDYKSDRVHQVSGGNTGYDRLGNDMSSSEYIHDLDYSKGCNLWILWYKFPVSRILFRWMEAYDRKCHYLFMEYLRDIWKEYFQPTKGKSPMFSVKM